MKSTIYCYCILSFAFLLPIHPTQAESLQDEKLSAQSVHLQKCASSVIKAFLFFEVGTATLYADECGNRLDTNTQKQIHFAYEREIPANAFAESSLNFLKKNLNKQDYQKWENAFIQFNASYLAVNKGDRYDLLHTPGNGLTLYFNSEPIAHNDSDDFAMAYFTIWFGDKPFNKKMKENLLVE